MVNNRSFMCYLILLDRIVNARQGAQKRPPSAFQSKERHTAAPALADPVRHSLISMAQSGDLALKTAPARL